MSTIEWLQNYFEECCNGDWERNYGIKIGTLDNPGWSVKIELKNTNLEDCSFEEVRIERDDNNWQICYIEDKIFKGYGGVKNLEEILIIFRDWVRKCGISRLTS
ncbi:MAG: immunity 53 family protein [Deltaproteobacteria bacterium]|nr:immunity 53 family protein [Deltaproteobacteria bacterium]